jgi:hypothetical protein
MQPHTKSVPWFVMRQRLVADASLSVVNVELLLLLLQILAHLQAHMEKP